MARMMYDRKEFTLPELLDNSTQNASILIPNLQRPYVWNPNQVSCLVDSLLRGWPFGTLLTWTVQVSKEEGIPSRPFFTLVDRTHSRQGKTATIRASSFGQTDTMVLDGQQRLQSLILALGASDGICMYDSEWIKLLEPSSRKRINEKHYTTASLCLNLAKFLSKMRECSYRLRSIGLHESGSLCWAVVNESLCSSEHRGGQMPLPRSEDGGFIALKSMWAQIRAEDEEDELRVLARQLLQGAFPNPERCSQFCDKIDGVAEAARAIEKFLRCLCDLKNPNLKITSLNVTAYTESSQASPEEKQRARQEYDDAIVGIFTRLNTAGRALTREEITFAWLKSTWMDAGNASDTYQNAEDFVAILKETFASWGTSDDDIVRALSILWCVHDPERHGRLLENRELLQAGIIRKMSKFLRENADVIIEAAKSIKDLYEDYHLTAIAESFNGVAIAWGLYFICEKARRCIMQTQSEHERDNSRKTIRDNVSFFLSRWVVLPSWGGNWSAHTETFLGQVSAKIAEKAANLLSSVNMITLIGEVKQLSNDVNEVARSGASNALRLCLRERKVFLYRSRLEIWQGLDQNRARFRTLTFYDANGQKEGVLQVDHIVAHEMWRALVEQSFADGRLEMDWAASNLCGIAKDEISRQKADNLQEFERRVKSNSIGFINSIGNCMLLNAGYNISKRKKPLGDFMDHMYEFQANTPDARRVDRAAWVEAMKLSDALIHPDKYSIPEISTAIQEREKAIYDDLASFIVKSEPVLY